MNRTPIVLTRSPAVASTSTAKVSRAGSIACDEGLFAELRALRKRLADEKAVPPYVIFGDTSLRHMCRSYPQTDRAFLDIPGVGSQKLADYGQLFMAEIKAWLAGHERQIFAAEAPPPPAPKMKSESGANGTALETLRLYRQGLSPEKIAAQRNLVVSTIHNHLAQAIANGALQADPRDYFSAEDDNSCAKPPPSTAWKAWGSSKKPSTTASTTPRCITSGRLRSAGLITYARQTLCSLNIMFAMMQRGG
jgi:ribonuclease D